ncbi:MAG TPA: response regulator, partial [Candidatus Sumerlaeota bacterium]|nr:response regulator [Candidatus Sumerlaeota bacterium]
MTTQDARSRILIVDDMETNIDILLKSLEAEYDVRVAMDGKTALQSVDEVMPDLILLDIMMPEMDGYEVCRRLKANKATQDIPIIFLTAVSMDASEHMGLSLGAIDYITKPFNFAIVKARVKNHVALRQSQLDVIRQRDELEIAYRKLQDLEKMRDDLERLIIHDMRSPLTSILGFLELVASEDRDGPGLDREECIRRAMDASQKLADMITALLDVSSLESGRLPLKCGNCDIRELADNVVNRLGGMADDLNVSVESSGVPVLAY